MGYVLVLSQCAGASGRLQMTMATQHREQRVDRCLVKDKASNPVLHLTPGPYSARVGLRKPLVASWHPRWLALLAKLTVQSCHPVMTYSWNT